MILDTETSKQPKEEFIWLFGCNPRFSINYYPLVSPSLPINAKLSLYFKFIICFDPILEENQNLTVVESD